MSKKYLQIGQEENFGKFLCSRPTPTYYSTNSGVKAHVFKSESTAFQLTHCLFLEKALPQKSFFCRLPPFFFLMKINHPHDGKSVRK